MVVLRIFARRLPQLIVVLLGVTLVTFLLINILPGNVAVLILGNQATPEAITTLTHQMGLDQPLLPRYVDWLGSAVHGDLGRSVFSGQPVWTAVTQRVPVTAELLMLALLLAVGVAIPAATLAARRPGGAVDKAIGVVAFGLLSTPNFIAGLVLVLLFSVTLKVLPASGWIPLTRGLGPNLQHAIMPAVALALTPFAFYTRLLRGDMVEQLTRAEYVITARAKGLRPPRILSGTCSATACSR